MKFSNNIISNAIKVIVTAVTLTSTVPALAKSAIQPGRYVGTGQWVHADGAAGQYQVETTVAAQNMSTHYIFAGQSREWAFTMLPTSNGFFNVASGDEGNLSGAGYCMDVQCHYEISSSKLEETITFVGDKMYKLGSKMDHGKVVAWQEALTLVP